MGKSPIVVEIQILAYVTSYSCEANEYVSGNSHINIDIITGISGSHTELDTAVKGNKIKLTH